MQVPQWAPLFPYVGGSNWDPELCLCGGSVKLTLRIARNSFLELVGSSRVYVFRVILIKFEPT